MLCTTQAVTMEYRRHGEITVPKGTRLTHETACGYDEGYFFVDEFEWLPPARPFLTHDAKHFGINIPKQFTTGE